jgi:hypothetical protein
MKFRFPNLVWGSFLLGVAAFLLFNQLDGFTSIGFGSIVVAILSLAFLVQCIARLHFVLIPIPLAVLYIVLRTPLELPYIQTWTLILASVLASIGLAMIFSKKRWHSHLNHRHYSRSGNIQMQTTDGNHDNNPTVSVNFGAVSRRLSADSLETVQLSCNFGALEIFFDKVELNPNGAEVTINCSFGAVELFVPKHWHIVDRLNSSLGGVEISNGFSPSEENAPRLTLLGNVSMGGIEVRSI